MRSYALLVALLGLACASPDDPRERMIEKATPELQRIQGAIVAHVETEGLFDFGEAFAGTVTPGGFGGVGLSGGVGSPSLGGGLGGPSLGGGVGGPSGGGGPAAGPSSAGGIDANFVDAVCDLFSGVCRWVAQCSEDAEDEHVCEEIFFAGQCRTIISEVLAEARIPAVPPQVTAAIRCIADRFPLVSCDGGDTSVLQSCVPGFVPDQGSDVPQ
jgi:hypothetical protein